ncbi:pseudouridine synthase [Thiomicrorhabdus cannonii]|uniref:pseudouridine synthase n=1 Tax=Thiomicrorhabdus cannonii TaxID=2748011 RepID=UPI0031B5C81C
MTPKNIRINQFFSRAGACSRRQADRWIAAGRVQVNGQTAKMGMLVSESDAILLDGQRIRTAVEPLYLLYHKPVGVVCTHDVTVKNNLAEALAFPERVFAVGRLDKDSEGLMLLTNQGEIVNRILRVENGHAKRYRVTVDKAITPEFLQQMAQGVPILNTVTRPAEIFKTEENVFELVLTQGLNRQIRRMCKALGYRVMRLQRLAIVHLQLGDLPVGAWRHLSDGELATLQESLQHSQS